MNNNRENRRHWRDWNVDETKCTLGAGNPISSGTEGPNTNIGGYPNRAIGCIGHINTKQDAKQRKKAMQEFLKNKKWR